MKKTVTTILSLALALILVSSLGNGVILAKGKKKQYKKVKVFQVAILDCVANTAMGGSEIKVDAFTISPELPDDVMIMRGDFCGATLVSLLSGGFKPLGDTGIAGGGFGVDPRSRYTLVKTSTKRVPVVNGHGDDDDDDDDDDD